MATASDARPPWPARARWLSRRSARLRLTLMFAGLFLLLGTAVIVIILALARSSSAIRVGQNSVAHAAGFAQPGGGSESVVPVPAGSPSGAQSFVVAQHNSDLDRLLAVSWVVLAVTTLGAALLGWFAAGRVLRPLREMAGTARTITAGNLHERLALAGPDDEFKQLGDTFDDLLGRLETAFDAQRRFVANASHELRTPLTVERTLLQVALANPEATEQSLRAACEELLASQVEHERLLEALLTLASSERGLERTDAVSLDALVAGAIATQTAAIERRGLRLESRLEPASIAGDGALLARLVANLIDNAVVHNVDTGWIEVRTGVQDGAVILMVANGGAPIAMDEIERLFEPFQRLEGRSGRPAAAAAGEHHGLGLSIVRAIATLHGGEVSAQARAGGGLDVIVRFPVVAVTPA